MLTHSLISHLSLLIHLTIHAYDAGLATSFVMWLTSLQFLTDIREQIQAWRGEGAGDGTEGGGGGLRLNKSFTEEDVTLQKDSEIFFYSGRGDQTYSAGGLSGVLYEPLAGGGGGGGSVHSSVQGSFPRPSPLLEDEDGEGAQPASVSAQQQPGARWRRWRGGSKGRGGEGGEGDGGGGGGSSAAV